MTARRTIAEKDERLAQMDAIKRELDLSRHVISKKTEELVVAREDLKVSRQHAHRNREARESE